MWLTRLLVTTTFTTAAAELACAFVPLAFVTDFEPSAFAVSVVAFTLAVFVGPVIEHVAPTAGTSLGSQSLEVNGSDSAPPRRSRNCGSEQNHKHVI